MDKRDIMKKLFARKTVMISLIFIIVMIFSAIFAPYLTPFERDRVDLEKPGQPPFPPSSEHILGTDGLGRDILTRLIYGARVSLKVGILVTVISMTVGIIIGTLAGFYGGKVDTVLSFLINVTLAFPGLLLAIAISVALSDMENRLFGVLAALSLVGWAGVARMVRASVMELRNREYVQAARLCGASDLRIMVLHILPNCFSLVLVVATLRMAAAILSESSLSFLGLGEQEPVPTWGSMIYASRQYIHTAPWMAIFPGLAIAATVIAFNLIGNALRDVLDPKMGRSGDS